MSVPAWNQMRDEYINRLIVVFGITSPIAAVASLIRLLSESWVPSMAIHIVVGVLSIIIATNRRGIPTKFKLMFMIGTFVAVGVLSINSFGFSAVGAVFLAGGAIITAITIGSRAAMIYTLVAAAIIATFGYYHVSHGLFPVDAEASSRDRYTWIANGVTYITLMFGLSFVVGRMNESLRRIVIELTHKNIEILALAEHDKLTGLWNNRVVHDRLQYILDKRKRHPQTIFVLFMDLDGFKAINDNFSHAIGDTALVITATRLRDIMRHEDTLARIGGDEFVAIIEIDVPPFSIDEIVNRLVSSCCLPFTVDGHDLRLGISIGVAQVGPTDDALYTPKMLLSMADKAMYSVKKSGKNGFAIYTPDMEEKKD